MQRLAASFGVQGLVWGVVLASALVAWNRGLALLYGLVALLLAVLLVSHVLSRLQLRGLGVTRTLPAHVEAGVPFNLRYRITAPGRRFFLGLHEVAATSAAGRLPAAFVAECVGVAEAQARVCFRQRGLYVLDAVEVESGWPFGVVRARRTLPVAAQTLRVLPRMFEVGHLPQIHAVAQDAGSLRSRRSGELDELAGLRLYRPGDALKRVSWPASARQMARGEPWLVKTFESFDHPSLLVVLDCGLPAGAEFECMLSIAAACLRHASAQGWPAVVCSAPAAGGPGLWALALPPHSLQWQDDLAVLATLHPTTAAAAYGKVLRQALVEHARSNTVLSFAREALVLPVERGLPRSHLAVRFGRFSGAPRVRHNQDGVEIGVDAARHDPRVDASALTAVFA